MWSAIQSYLGDNLLLAISTPLYILLIALEVIVSNSRRLHFYSIPETLINLWLNIANTLIGLSVKGAVLLLLTFAYQYRIFSIEHTVLYWALLFFLLDFCFYLEHLSEHYCRVLWAVHVTHHSSTEFNLTTGFRSSVFRPLVSCWFFLPLAVLGFRPLDILLMDAICQIYGIVVHTRFVKKMPYWFEWLFVSPSHHRVHHASNVVYLDKNMGMVLIIWDRMFGTFQEELDAEEVVYGLTKNPSNPHHPVKIITHEWFSLKRDVFQQGIQFMDRIKYLIYPPGWSHDGSTKTAKELRKELDLRS